MDEITQPLQRVRPPNARIQPRGEAASRPALSAREVAEQGAESSVGFDTGGRLMRRRRRTDDKFYVDRTKIPAGWSYEWKRQVVYGQPDTDHQVNLRENHWTPVPADRHPEMMPIGHTGPIVKDGMILMERPQYLTEEALREDYEWAMEQVRGASRQVSETPSGTFTREHPSVQRIARIKHSYGPINAED